jgi:phosphoglycerate dehydrogenase-like enzyme
VVLKKRIGDRKEMKNKKKKVCFLIPNNKNTLRMFAGEDIDRLRKSAEVSIWDGLSDKKTFLSGADIIVTTWGSPKIELSVLETSPEFAFLFHCAGTVKHVIDIELMKRGIRVSSASNILGRNVAITTFGLILVAIKKIPWWNEYIKSTEGWRENKQLLEHTNEIGTASMGVISMSHVGRNLVSLLKNVTDRIFVYDPYWNKEDIAKFGGRKVDNLYDIADRCDVVALCTPLLKSTEGMLDREFFQRMKDGAVFVNPSRGAILDESALVEELRKERIFACLDVTNPEPPSAGSPLRGLKNIVLSPHIAGIINSGLPDMGRFCVEEIKRFLEGKELFNEVKLEKLDITA